MYDLHVATYNQNLRSRIYLFDHSSPLQHQGKNIRTVDQTDRQKKWHSRPEKVMIQEIQCQTVGSLSDLDQVS